MRPILLDPYFWAVVAMLLFVVLNALRRIGRAKAPYIPKHECFCDVRRSPMEQDEDGSIWYRCAVQHCPTRFQWTPELHRRLTR